MIDIKDISGNIRFSTPINEGSKRKFLLMKEDYITLKFSVDEPVYFKLGDYVDDSFGLFELCDLCKPTYNQNTGGYDYELRLDAHYWKWKNKIFKYTPEVGGKEASWNLTANLKTHLDVLLRNLKALDYKYKETGFSYDIDKTVETSAKLLSYDNTNLLDALTMLAEAWECEWWITNSVIHFGRCEFSDPVNFELGKNVESMTQSDSQSNYATRIYAFGSERNIHPTYRRKLVFNVTNVTGRNFSDASRPLEYNYFPSRDYISVPEIVFSFSKEESKRYTSLPLEYSVEFKVFDSLKAGKYNIHPENIQIGVSGMGINSITASLLLLYSIDGEEKKIVLQKSSGSGAFSSVSKFGDGKFELYKDASNIRLHIDAAITYAGINLDVNALFNTSLIGSLQNRAVSSVAAVTFISGPNAGKSFNSIFNPNFSEGSDANIIQLPEGVTASLGDTYVIDNIIKGKVPIGYFSNDLEDVVVSGIVQKRLMLPIDTPYIDAHSDMTTEETVEAVVVFDDVYPHRVGVMSDVAKHPINVENEDGKLEEVNLFRFKDSGIIFSKDYIIPGSELQITFESGILNGMIFGVKFNPDNKNPEEQLWQIVRNDDYGRMLPDDTMFPKDGNKYALSGFDTAFVSETMVTDAEKELKEKAEKYIKKNQIDPSTYDCTMMSDRMIDKNGNFKMFEVGDRVNLVNAAFFDSGKRESRIIGFEYSLDIPYDSPSYVIGETAPYSRIGEIEDKIDSLTYKGKAYSNQSGASSGGNVYLIRTTDSTPATDSNAFSAKRSLSEFINKKENDTALGHITFERGITTLNLLVQSLAKTYDLEVDHVATMFRTIIKDYISSETFIPGMLGEGAKLYKSLTGDWNLELDNVTVRKAITTFEMVISKVRAVNGGLVISAANGKVKSVATTTGDPVYYVLGIEGDMTFVADDLVRCQVFTSGSTKYYWCPIEQINGDSILILKSGFPDGVVPAEGDELVQMGNRTDIGRQGVLYLTASEDGKPRFSVLDGINSPTLAGKNKVILGCLDGITDTDFPADYQPSGYGLYAMNVFLKGLFILRNGKTVDGALSELSAQIEAIPGQISLKVTEEVGKVQLGGRNYVLNSSDTYSVGSSAYWQRIALSDMEVGETYILSLHAATYDSTIVLMVTDADNTDSQIINVGVPFILSEKKKYFAFTNNGLGGVGVFSRIKIEKGNKATDWTPAPEDIEARMSQAELSLKPENIWLGIKSNVQEVAKGTIVKSIDARGLDENTYYPLVIDVPNTPMTTITVSYALYGIKPSWATHGSGFSLQIRWTTNGGGWGAIPIQRTIHEATQSFCTGNVAGNIWQIGEYNKEYIYVRGGGYYYVNVSGIDGDDSIINLYPNGASFGSDPYVRTISPVSSVVFPIPAIAGILGTGIDITNGKIVATSDKFVVQDNSGNQMAVFENGRIKANMIDTRTLNVSDGAMIGGFSVSDGSLISNSSSRIAMYNSGYSTNMYPGQLNISHPSAGNAININGGDANFIGNTFSASYSNINLDGNISIGGGCILRNSVSIKIDIAYGTTSLGSDACYVVCRNSSNATITLPYYPNTGHVIYVRRQGGGVTVQGGRYNLFTGNVVSSRGIDGNGDILMCVFDGVYWNTNFIGR